MKRTEWHFRHESGQSPTDNVLLLHANSNHVTYYICAMYIYVTIYIYVCATTVTAVVHHHMSLTFSIKSHRAPASLAPVHTPCLFSIDLHTVRQHLVIVHFLLLLLLTGTLFQMMSGIPHHCHHLSLVWRHTCFVQVTKTELYPWSLYICAWIGLVIALLMVFLKNALMCVKKVTLINHDCLPISMLLHIMLYIMLAYSMLFAALSNAVCLQMLFCFMFCLGLFQVWSSIMHSAFSMLVFPNYMFTPFFMWKVICSLLK